MPFNVTLCQSAEAQVSARASYDVLLLRLQAKAVRVCDAFLFKKKRRVKAKGLEKLRFCSANTGSESRRLQLTLRMFSC